MNENTAIQFTVESVGQVATKGMFYVIGNKIAEFQMENNSLIGFETADGFDYIQGTPSVGENMQLPSVVVNAVSVYASALAESLLTAQIEVLGTRENVSAVSIRRPSISVTQSEDASICAEFRSPKTYRQIIGVRQDDRYITFVSLLDTLFLYKGPSQNAAVRAGILWIQSLILALSGESNEAIAERLWTEYLRQL